MHVSRVGVARGRRRYSKCGKMARASHEFSRRVIVSAGKSCPDCGRFLAKGMESFRSGGVRIAYVDLPPPGGDGAPVLLIHGFASNHAVNWVYPSWTTTLNRAGFRVIAHDNRGHGESDKPYDPAAYTTDIMAE